MKRAVLAAAGSVRTSASIEVPVEICEPEGAADDTQPGHEVPTIRANLAKAERGFLRPDEEPRP